MSLLELKQYIDNCDIINASIIINNIENNDKGFISLKIRYLILIDDYKNLDIIINEKNLMKRDYINFMIYINKKNMIDYCINIFNNYIKDTHLLDTKDIDIFIHNKMFYILELLDGYYYKTSYTFNIINKINIKKYNISKKYREKIIEIYSDKLPDSHIFSCYIKSINFDCIIDCGNLLHYNKGKINYDIFYKILGKIKKKYKNPLIIANYKHKKKLNLKIKENIYYSPFNINDDYYLILAYVLSLKPIITNDKFKDHIFELSKNPIENNYILNKITENIINYNINNIFNNQNYSCCIQISNNKIYIPTIDNSFYIIKL